jgi:hypothetical protein
MATRLKEVVREFEQRLRRMQHLPRFSYGRGLVRDDGRCNAIVLSDHDCTRQSSLHKWCYSYINIKGRSDSGENNKQFNKVRFTRKLKYYMRVLSRVFKQ